MSQIVVFAAAAVLLGAATSPSAAAAIRSAERPAVNREGTHGAVESRPTGEPVWYQPPVDAAVVDPFRPPPTRYGPGNRGIDYDTSPGQPVRTAAAGTVVFVGQVGPHRHVVVLHADGLRTTYAFVVAPLVHADQRVRAADMVARAGERLHFGARAGRAYLDPQVLLSGKSRTASRLVREPLSGLG